MTEENKQEVKQGFGNKEPEKEVPKDEEPKKTEPKKTDDKNKVPEKMDAEKAVSEKKDDEKVVSEKKDDKKKKAVKKSKKKKLTMPKIEKPSPSKKIKDMTPKEKRDFDKEMEEYKEKVKAAKLELQIEKNKAREQRSENFKKTPVGKVVNKIKPKKKAPKLVDPKVASEEKKRNVPKRVDRRTKTMRKRIFGVAFMCVAVTAVILGGFKIAGALEINAGQASKTGDKYFTEAEVTKYITEQTFYKTYSKSASNWSQYLSMYGMTPETFRKQVIEDHFQHDELVRLAAEKEEITVDEDEVDKHVENFKSKYDSDANYRKALENAGYTEDTYRDHIYQTQMEKNLIAKVVTTDPPSDDDVKTYLSSASTTYKDARRSSHILFDSKDSENAQKVLDQINAGTLTFEAAVATYSKDSATKDKGGDRGWDKIESFTSAYNSGLSGLAAGEINKELVTDKDGIHIVKCTEKWDTPEKIESLDGVPQAIIDECRKKKNESNQETKLKEWLETFASDNGINSEIFPMPSNVPYNVDMSKANKSSSSSASSSSSSTTDTSSEVSDETESSVPATSTE